MSDSFTTSEPGVMDPIVRPTPTVQALDIDGGYALAVLSEAGDPEAPNLAMQVMVRTILAVDRASLEPQVAPVLVAEFGMTNEEAEELVAGLLPPATRRAAKPERDDGKTLSDDERRDASQPKPEDKPADKPAPPPAPPTPPAPPAAAHQPGPAQHRPAQPPQPQHRPGTPMPPGTKR